MSAGSSAAVSPETDSADVGKALQEALEERNRLWEELNRRVAQERELEYYRELNANIMSSFSWRVTAPLRAGKTVAERARRLWRERS